MKNTVFVITYIAYAVNHMLRTSYAFNKAHVKETFQLSDFYLGLMDALMYICYGFGTLGRYTIAKSRNLPQFYLVSCIGISISYALIPGLSLHLQQNIHPKGGGHFNQIISSSNTEQINGFILTASKIVITISISMYGFFMLAVWQVCLALMSEFWHPEKEGCIMGFWGAMISVGNIVGFFLSNFMVHSLNLRWENSMLLFAIMNLSMGLVFYFLLENPSKQYTSVGDQNYSLQNQLEEEDNYQTTGEFFEVIFRIARTNSRFLYYFLAYWCIKVVLYSFLMWFPIYLVSKGMASVSGYIPTLFDVFCIIGGIIFSKLYEYPISNNLNPVAYVSLKYKGVISIGTVIVLLILFIKLPIFMLTYVILTPLIGFFLGGIFISYGTNDQMIFGENNLKQTDYVSNFCIGVGSLLIGTFQLVIAFVIQKPPQKVTHLAKESDYDSFFYVILVITVVALGLIFFRSRNQQSVQRGQISSSQDEAQEEGHRIDDNRWQ